LRFSSYKDVYRNAGKGTHSCNVFVAGSVGMVLPLRLVLTELILRITSIERSAMGVWYGIRIMQLWAAGL